MNPIRPVLGLLLAALATPSSAQIVSLDGRHLTSAQIDAEVQARMTEAQVTGLGLALIRGGRVVFAKSYGLKNVARGEPLQSDTVMYGASLTKATFSYFVLQLVGEGKVDLDAPIARYLPQPLPAYPEYASLGADDRWQKLTFRILLNHTSGFANLKWMEPDKQVHFHRDPGTRYGYSGEGMRLAQFVLEKGLHLDVAAEMQRRLFDPLKMQRTSMLWRAAFDPNNADGYDDQGAFHEHRVRNRADAAGSLDTTLADWASFLAAASRGWGLKPAQRAEMVRRTVEIDGVSQFPTLREDRTDRWKAIGLGYGVGWGVLDSKWGRVFFKEGHDDGTDNIALCVDRRRDCILLLSNDNRASRIFGTLIDRLLGPVPFPWDWEGYAPPAAR